MFRNFPPRPTTTGQPRFYVTPSNLWFLFSLSLLTQKSQGQQRILLASRSCAFLPKAVCSKAHGARESRGRRAQKKRRNTKLGICKLLQFR